VQGGRTPLGWLWATTRRRPPPVTRVDSTTLAARERERDRHAKGMDVALGRGPPPLGRSCSSSSPSLAAAAQASHWNRGRVSVSLSPIPPPSAAALQGEQPAAPYLRGPRPRWSPATTAGESPKGALDRVSGGDRFGRGGGATPTTTRPTDACQGTTRVRLRRARPDRAGEAGRRQGRDCRARADLWPRVSTTAAGRHGRRHAARARTWVASTHSARATAARFSQVNILYYGSGDE
jgi:hypothetical protein